MDKPYLLKALPWAVLTWLLAHELAGSRFWLVVLGVFLLAAPIVLGGMYGSTIVQIRRLQLFARRGWIYRLLSGRPLKIVLWLCWALPSAFFMLVQFHTYGALEWTAFFLVIPVFWGVFSLARRLIARELKPYLVTHLALSWARWLCPLLMLLLFLALLAAFAPIPAYPSLRAAVEAQQAAVAGLGGSALLREVSGLLAFHDGLRAYALGRLGETDSLRALALPAAGAFVIFYNACAILSCFLIPAKEYRRVFAPLSDAGQPPAVPRGRMALTVAVTTFLALFVYLPLFAYLEAWMQQNPRVEASRRIAEAQAIQQLERIDAEYFQAGTLASIEDARVEALRRVEVSLAQLEGSAEAAFDSLEGNVDLYLDWYYSLVGEYSRIGHLMVGELESYMLSKLEESLRRGDAFEEVQAALNAALAEHREAREYYRQAVQAIMAENRVDPDGAPVLVLRELSLESVLAPPIHEDMIDLEDRLIAGGRGAAVAGAVTAVVAKKVVGKVVGKNIFKLAAASLGKVVLGKAAGSSLGAGAGAAAGAAAGSVVPGLGTAIGAVLGGIAGGIAVGITIDKMLIELEESINREEFRREILAAIEQARLEFMARLRG